MKNETFDIFWANLVPKNNPLSINDEYTRREKLSNSVKGMGRIPASEEGCNILLGKIMLSGSGNLTRSDFDHSKLFQSQKQNFVNIEHRLKSKLARLVSTKSMKLKKMVQKQ